MRPGAKGGRRRSSTAPRSHDSGVYVKERSPQLCRWILVAFVVVVLLFCVVASASRSFLFCFTDWSQRKLLSLFAFPVCSSRLPFLPRVFCRSTYETSVTPRLFGGFFFAFVRQSGNHLWSEETSELSPSRSR